MHRLLAVVVLGLGTLVGLAPAVADDYIDCRQGAGVCGPDDAVHYWCLGASMDGYPNMKDAATWAMATLQRDTAITATQVASCTQYTDVRFVQANIGATTAGRYTCVTWAGADHQKPVLGSDSYGQP